jgi:hypothetical protein
VLGDQAAPALDVLDGLLQLDPGLRIPAQAALESSWLKDGETPGDNQGGSERVGAGLGVDCEPERTMDIRVETRVRLLEPWLGPARRKWDEME